MSRPTTALISTQRGLHALALDVAQDREHGARERQRRGEHERGR